MMILVNICRGRHTEANPATGCRSTCQSERSRCALVGAVTRARHRYRILHQWYKVNHFIPCRIGCPYSKVRPIGRRVKIRFKRHAVRPSFLVRELQPAQIPIRQIAQGRMLEDVVPVPLDNCPVELLPPTPGKCKATIARATQGRDCGRHVKVALQIPMGTKFLELFSHDLKPNRDRQIASGTHGAR
jgi:hypothetical protein